MSLKEARLSMGLTVKEFASKMDLSVSTIYRLDADRDPNKQNPKTVGKLLVGLLRLMPIDRQYVTLLSMRGVLKGTETLKDHDKLLAKFRKKHRKELYKQAA